MREPAVEQVKLGRVRTQAQEGEGGAQGTAVALGHGRRFLAFDRRGGHAGRGPRISSRSGQPILEARLGARWSTGAARGAITLGRDGVRIFATGRGAGGLPKTV
jgi:hypothetical protein